MQNYVFDCIKKKDEMISESDYSVTVFRFIIDFGMKILWNILYESDEFD